MKILFIDSVHPFLSTALKADGHECIDGFQMDREEIKRMIGDMDGLVIRSRIVLDQDILHAAGKLSFIARAGAGMESIDVAYAEHRGIACLNSPEGNRDAVGEHAVAMLLSLFNNLNKADAEVRKSFWIREENRGHELKDKTVGIIGFGNMGSAFAEKLSGFNCRILAYDKYKSGFSNQFVNESGLDKIFEECDVISLHVPLNAETEFLINDAFLKKFRKSIYLINTARGKCVNTDDLVMNMKSGKVSGTCLDVLEYEDISFEKFGIRNSSFEKSETWQNLISSDRVILSPHIAGWTMESHKRISEILYEKIKGLNL